MAQHIYFVRHGITKGNETQLIQGADDVLSEQGVAQARRLADRLANVRFEKLISSDLHRARQTAEIVAARTGHKVEVSALFQELQYPDSLIGLDRYDERIRAYWQEHERQSGEGNLDWKLEGEESFNELADRMLKAFEYAVSQEEENIVVVTHGHFLRKLAPLILFGREVIKRWNDHSAPLAHSNTGITLFSRTGHPIHQGPQWCLHTWNDHAHLG